MTIAYFKRFKMEIDLQDLPPVPPLADGYAWVAWDDSRLELHAEVKYASFQDEIDAGVFESLSDREGCSCLMREIRAKPGFIPEATWLVGCADGYCGTVQGVRERGGVGSIQNLGVVPEHRGLGLGSALLLKALEGFRCVGLKRGFLEVTARNESAVRLYHRLGFRRRKTVYKAVAALPAIQASSAFPLWVSDSI